MALSNNLSLRNLDFRWNWSAIFAGVFVGLAVEVLLLLLGAAIGTSTGDHLLGAGFGIWYIFMTMLGLAIGGFVAAWAARSGLVRDGLLIGFLVWSVVVVLSTSLFLSAFGPQTVGAGFWSKFLGACFGLVCALIGGALGSRLHLRAPVERPLTRTTTTPITDETLTP